MHLLDADTLTHFYYGNSKGLSGSAGAKTRTSASRLSPRPRFCEGAAILS